MGPDYRWKPPIDATGLAPTMQYSGLLQCNTVAFTVHYSVALTMQCSIVVSNAILKSAILLQCNTIVCDAQQCNSMSCIMICTMIFYNNFLQIFNEKQELFYSVLLYFCDSVFVFQCLCFLVIVQKCALVQFSHDLPMAKWQNCRWRRMAKLAKWANGSNGQFALLQFWAQNTKQNKKLFHKFRPLK